MKMLQSRDAAGEAVDPQDVADMEIDSEEDSFEDTHTPFVLEPGRTTSNLTPHGEHLPVAGHFQAGHFEPHAAAKESSLTSASDARGQENVNVIYTVFSHPFGSKLGRMVWRVILFFIIFSVLEIVLEAFVKGERYAKEMKPAKEVWTFLEYPITVFFTLELLARLFVASKTTFRSMMTFEVLFLYFATIPLYIELILSTIISTKSVVYKAVNLLRLARFCRLASSAPEGKLMAPVCVSLIVVWGIYKQKSLTSDY
mmetsp:Transcript_39621/g.91973  ORF Transcript_39621/g.91973 Transcript_39621/m.91973 type:complete len:256 (-) Transcript_39621:75-842(-)